MKLIPLVALATFTTAAFAGQPIAPPSKTAVIPEACFGETELQIDVFGAYTSSDDGDFGDGFGGGAGVNYFFARYFGLGLDAAWTDGNDGDVWVFRGSLLARWPIDSGTTCWAPYLRLSGGVQTADDGE